MSAVAVASLKYPDIPNVIGGTAVPDDVEMLDVYDPSTGAVISRVPMSGGRAVDAAVQAAQRALKGWAETPIKDRVQIFFRYRQLLEKNLPELSALVTEENGKVASEAQ